jgi:hypothetical protein
LVANAGFYSDPPKATGFCLEHFYDRLRSFKDGAQENGQGEKKRRGRKAGDKYLDEEKSLSDIKDFIVDVWKEAQVLDEVTQKAVAARFQRRGEKIGEKAVKRRLERAGIATPWAEFRQSVLKERGEL